MRRWNGWGDHTTTYALTPTARQFVAARLGAGTPPQDARLADVLATVPASRLPDHPLIETAAEDRLRHARGQSLPDWIALRAGQLPAVPDGVAYPTTSDDVQTLIALAADHNLRLVPYGGGTSVVGHINATPGARPLLTVDMSRLNRLLDLDPHTHLATFGAGVSGPDLEAQLRAQGFTLGHYPQSFEYSTLGGWIATRSSGQQSLYYGRIEGLFAGGVIETPAGRLQMPAFPASAAGPDLREIVLGSEGRLGIITEATVRIARQPEQEGFRAIFFPTFAAGMDAVREMAQARLPLSMLRLSNAAETETQLALAGHERAITWLERILAANNIGADKSLMFYGATGNRDLARTATNEAVRIAHRHGGAHLYVGRIFGAQWQKSRFKTPYLRNTLWEKGYAVDTLETAVTWSNAPALLAAVEAALRDGLADEDERVHVFSHLSHVYPHGTSLYTTYLFRLADDPAHNLARWERLKAAASQAIVAHGGTISHQHGVGRDHQPYLAAEKGALGLGALDAVLGHFDPAGVMNPGVLRGGDGA